MKLITKEIEKALLKNPLYSHEGEMTNAKVIVKFFNPWGIGRWFVTEAEKQGDDWLFFGYVQLHENEWGYFRLSELESVKLPFGLKIERDAYLGKDATVGSCVKI